MATTYTVRVRVEDWEDGILSHIWIDHASVGSFARGMDLADDVGGIVVEHGAVSTAKPLYVSSLARQYFP